MSIWDSLQDTVDQFKQGFGSVVDSTDLGTRAVFAPMNEDVARFGKWVNDSGFGKTMEQIAQTPGTDVLMPGLPMMGLTRKATSGIFHGWLDDLVNATAKREPGWAKQFFENLKDTYKGTKNLVGAKYSPVMEGSVFDPLGVTGTLPYYDKDAAAYFIQNTSNIRGVHPEALARLAPDKPAIVSVAGKAHSAADFTSDLSHEGAHFLTMSAHAPYEAWDMGNQLREILRNNLEWKGMPTHQYGAKWTLDPNEAIARSVESEVVNRLGIRPNRHWQTLGLDPKYYLNKPAENQYHDVVTQLVRMLLAK